MIQVRYAQLDWMDDEQFNHYLAFVPKKVQDDIKRFRKIDDRKSKLLGKLMLLNTLIDDNKVYLLDNLDLVDNQKPAIEGWYEFNISHSGNFVLFCWSEIPVGIDIEKQQENITSEITSWLHPVELEHVINSSHNRKCFFDIWTKKEALLKNTGCGLIDNLNEINCVNLKVKHNHRDFYFYPIAFHPDYSAHICHTMESEHITIQAFRPESLRTRG
ncbi:MAG: 4'-phosphopantetheinyl transferase superfamily protein [Ferruginibacter sp.]|nr:4'-phosphopantetheinyl transferase superfamily protein [Ferruginibacter sp.]